MQKQISYLLTADNVILEKGTEKHSLIGIFDDVLLRNGSSEILIPSFVLFFKVLGSRDISKVEIEIKTPAGLQLTQSPVVMITEQPIDKDTLTVAATLQNLTFREVGQHSIIIRLNGEEVIPANNQSINVVEV